MLTDSVRQIKRILRCYRILGLPGLISKKRGRVSNRRVVEAIRISAITMIGEHYYDFETTLAAEKMAERHDIHGSLNTKITGISPHRNAPPIRRGLCTFCTLGKSRNLRLSTPLQQWVNLVRYCCYCGRKQNI